MGYSELIKSFEKSEDIREFFVYEFVVTDGRKKQ